MKIILLNGPPRSGKDTAASAIVQGNLRFGGPSVIHEKFSAPLKTAFAGMMGVEMQGWNVGEWEQHKEKDVYDFGFSFRKWQQDFSEKFMKPCYGENIFGKMLWSRIYGFQGIVVISDCGFQIEVDYLLEHVNPKDVMLIRLHRVGSDYSRDTREYVNNPYIHCLDVVNDKDKAFFEVHVCQLVEWWLKASHP